MHHVISSGVLHRLARFALPLLSSTIARVGAGNGRPVRGDVAEQGPLLVWTMDRLGDVVRATVALRLLARRHPHSPLVVVAPARAATALANNPHVAELIVIRRHYDIREHLAVAARLRRRRWAGGVLLEVDPNWAMLGQLLCTLMRVPELVLLDLGQPIARGARPLQLDDSSSWLRQFQRLAAALGAEPDATVRPELFPSEQARKAVAVRLRARGIDPAGPMFLLHPGGGAHTVSRQWPASAFGALVTQLRQRWPYPVLVSGLAHERRQAAQLARAAAAPVHDLTGELSLSELIALISLNTLCIMNDTGPLHLAFALGRPAVAVLGPTGAETVGVPPDAAVATTRLPCQPCAFLTGWQRCANPIQWECLTALTPQMVLAAVEQQVAHWQMDVGATPGLAGVGAGSGPSRC